MLRFNMICPEGHKHWSPTPASFIGRECGTRTCKGILKSYNDPSDLYARPKYHDSAKKERTAKG